MQKRLFSLAVLCLFVFGLASVAMAEVKKFTNISVDVPADYMVAEEDGLVIVASPDERYFFSVGVAARSDFGGKDDKTIATEVSKKVNGSTPEEGEGGGWSFTAIADGTKMDVDIMGDDDFVLIFMYDTNGDWPEAFSSVFTSIKGNDPKTHAFLQKVLLPD